MKLLSSKPSDAGKPEKSLPNLNSLDDAIGHALDRTKRVRRLHVGYPRLERLCRPQLETFWVIGGRPGSFKTALLWNLALNAAEARQRVLFVSLEMTPAELGLLALARFSALDRRRIEARFSDQLDFDLDEQGRWDRSVLRLQALEMNLRLHGAEEHGRTLEQLMHSACRSRFDAVFIDHAGMIDRGRGNELDALSRSIDRLRALSRGEVSAGYRPWVVVTAQLSRGIDRDAKPGEDRTPGLSDFRGSARFEHDADVAIGLQVQKRKRDDDSPVTCLDAFVLKNRFGPNMQYLPFTANGATGMITERALEHDQAED
jgi:replicative DNA helicase